jgi:hypothetical protein
MMKEDRKEVAGFFVLGSQAEPGRVARYSLDFQIAPFPHLSKGVFENGPEQSRARRSLLARRKRTLEGEDCSESVSYEGKEERGQRGVLGEALAVWGGEGEGGVTGGTPVGMGRGRPRIAG